MSPSGQIHIHNKYMCVDKSPMGNSSVKYVFMVPILSTNIHLI